MRNYIQDNSWDKLTAKRPREAAVAIVGHVNNRNPNISLLALTVRGSCVKMHSL